MKKFFVVALIAVALALASVATACKDDDDDGGDDTPISKTYPITLKDGALKFTVEYIALPNEEPAYLTYLQTRLTAFTESDLASDIDITSGLMSKGSNFTIKVEYDGASYGGMVWSTAKQAFTVHNDWISGASGFIGQNALTFTSMENAFKSVEVE